MTEILRADQLLMSIVEGKRAWSSHHRLSRRFGEAMLEIMQGLGFIEPWAFDRQGKRLRAKSWTLTPWGAERLGVEIDERLEIGGEEVPFWVKAGDGSTYCIQPPERGSSPLRHPERVPDPRSKSGPEYLIDVETGETTRDESEAKKLWGVPLKVAMSRQKKAAAARRKEAGKPSDTDRRRTGKSAGRSTQGRSTHK